jgi:hypothetical protein
MSTIEEIEVAIEQLPRDELFKLANWISSKFADEWDKQIQEDIKAALKGALATLPSVRALHLETWIMQAYGGKIPLLVDLMVFLQPLRFRLFDLGTQFRKDDGALYSIDACFVNEAFA